jgi:MscS family membrane protein
MRFTCCVPAVRGRRPRPKWLAKILGSAWKFVLFVALAHPIAAQAPQSSQTSSPAAPVADPLGRNTPRGTIAGFTAAVHRNDFVVAEEYMQVTAKQHANAEALARDLTALMDRYFTQPFRTLSGSPAGVPNDGLPLDRDRVPLSIAGKTVDIVLVRVNDPQAGPIWLLSSETLAQVSSLRHFLDATWVERLMPPPLVTRSLFGISLAQWTLWAASIGVPLLLLWVLSVLVIAAAKRSARDPARRRLLDSWNAVLRWPVVLILLLGIHLAFMPFLGFSLTFRMTYIRYASVVSILVLAWLMWRFLTLSFVYAEAMVRRRGQARTQSLMLIGERVVKVLIILLTIFAILTVAGVDTTTALAGVGIGGVALAFGAQKSVENLLGGVFLLTDQALAVGDFCCISDRMGWIEDITLRSIRLRTLEQTLLSIPAGVLSQANIENFATRRKMLLQSTLRLRYGTSTEQLRSILDRIHTLLAEHPQLERESARIRLVAFGANAIELEMFAYVKTGDAATFMAVRESLLLAAAVIVESSGSAFARPTDFLYFGDRPADHAQPELQDRTLALTDGGLDALRRLKTTGP